MSFACEFCQGSFSTATNLKYHQNHAKSCLILQGRVVPENPACRYCSESYSTIYRLRAHEEKCEKRPTPTEEKMAEEIVRLEREVRDCHHQIQLLREENARLHDANIKHEALSEMYRERMNKSDEILAKRAKVTNKTTNIYHGNTITQSLDLSNTEHIHSKLERHLDQETIGQGQIGIARSVVQNILTTDNGELLYVCTDQDRHIFRYLNEDGKEVKDIRAGHLKDALQRSGIGRIAVERGEQVWTKEDGSVDVDKMMAYHPRVVEIGMMGSEEHDHRFRNELARLTTVPS